MTALRDALEAAEPVLGVTATTSTVDPVTGRPVTGVDLAEVDPEAADLLDRAESGLAHLTTALAAVVEVTGRPLPASSAAEPEELVRARAVVRLLLGNEQPFLAVVTLAEPAGYAAALADREALLAGDADAAVDWVQRTALVRPGLDPLAAVLVHREAAGADVAAELQVLGVPHRPGTPWLALPWGDAGPPPDGAVGVVLHAPDGMDPTAGGAGVVVDAWTETVPAVEETTAVAFHYDAPGARAPQSMLLAVTPDPAAATWDFDTVLGCVHEALDLARLRTLGSAELAPFSTFLPALFLPEDYTRDAPGIRWSELLANATSVSAAFGLVGDHVLGSSDLTYLGAHGG